MEERERTLGGGAAEEAWDVEVKPALAAASSHASQGLAARCAAAVASTTGSAGRRKRKKQGSVSGSGGGGLLYCRPSRCSTSTAWSATARSSVSNSERTSRRKEAGTMK